MRVEEQGGRREEEGGEGGDRGIHHSPA